MLFPHHFLVESSQVLQQHNTYSMANQVKNNRKKVVVEHKDDAHSFVRASTKCSIERAANKLNIV